MKTRLMLAFLVALFLSLPLFAEVKPADPKEHEKETPGKAEGEVAPVPCSVEDLTRNCALFDPKKTGRKISLPDGTHIPNFAYVPAEHDEKKEGKETDVERRDRERSDAEEAFVTLQENLVGVLDALGKENASLRFTIAMTDSGPSPSVFKEIWESWAHEKASPKDKDRSVQLPFPPDDPKAKMAFVSFDKVREWMDDNLTDQKENVIKWLKASKLATEKLRDADSTEEDRKDRVVTPERAKKVAGLFQTALKKAGEIFSSKLANPKITDAEKTYIKAAQAKLAKLKLRSHDDSAVKDADMCRSPIPNAWYDPETLTVSICPAMYNFPDATLIQIMGHEAGHAIDPCNSQCAVCSIDKEKLKARTTPEKEGETALPPFEEMMLNGQLQYSLDQGSSQTSAPLGLTHSPELLKKYETEGVIKTEIAGTPFESYPLKEIYDCLSSAKGGGFRKYSAEEVQKIAKELAAEKANEKVGPRSAKWQKDEEKRVTAALSKFPECVGVHRNSHMGEATADWIGAKVLGSYLKDLTAKGTKLDTPAKRLSVVGFSASLACMRHFSEEEKAAKDRLDIARVIEEYRALGDPHPGSKARMERITLRNSEVRKALGCAGNDDECGKGWGAGT